MGSLSVYSASAGSGKTYTIAYEYISMMLTGGNSYRNILAVTFTNKACDEMKSRIVKNLFQIARVDSMPQGKKRDDVELIIEKIIGRTGLLSGEIIRRSAMFFKSIIHDYSFFSVFTIDSFFQKIVRNLTYELELQQNYELELHTDLVISQLVDDLMLLAEDDAELNDDIAALIDSNIANDRKWSPKSLMTNFIKQAIDFEFDVKCDIDAYEKEKDNVIQVSSEKIKGYFNEIEELAVRNNIGESDFYGGATRGNHHNFKKIQDLLQKSSRYNDTLFENYRVGTFNDNWFVKKSPYADTLSGSFAAIVEKLNDEYRRFCTAWVIKKNLDLLRLQYKATDVLNENLNKESLFLLSKVPSILSSIIVGSSDSLGGISVMPFVFEKVGVRYSNYMIDEFQDTSNVQWNIFKTMLHDALAQGADSIIVGDKKQSIYSWRGGDWKILAGLAYDNILKPYVDGKSLPENHRTARNIVLFNNDFFSREYPSLIRETERLHTTVNRESIKNFDLFGEATLYDDVEQKITKEEDSEVKVRLYEGALPESDDDVKNRLFADMLAEIEDLQENYNVSPNQIKILVRNGKDARFIAESFLAIPRIKPNVCYDVVSNDSLFIASNPAVRLIIAYMRYMLNPNDELSQIEAAYMYHHIKDKLADDSSFDKELLKNELSEAIGSEPFGWQSFEIVETLINRLGLNKEENVPFLIAFRNVVHDFSDKSTDLQAFLDYWDERGCGETLKIPENQNAMEIITVHKSKGLESDYIFIPFCNWKLDEGSHGGVEYIFYEEEVDGQNVFIPIENTSNLLDTDMCNIYKDIKYRKNIESFNLLYVAFTRAKHGLYVSAYEKSTKKEKEITKVSLLLKNYFTTEINSSKIEWNVTETEVDGFKINTYSFGSKPATKPKNYEGGFISMYPVCEKPAARIVSHLRDDIDGSMSARLKGTRYHSVFEHIVTIDDVEPVVKSLFDNGEIDKHECENLATEICAKLNDVRLKHLFDGSGKVYNEFNIIDPNATDDKKLKRPDRVVVFDDEIVVLDYKFGMKKDEKYSEQVRDYARLISGIKAFAGMKVSSYVWYYFLNELEIVV